MTLIGTTFINSNMLFCKFGTALSKAKFIAVSRAECDSPAVAAAGSVSLTLSNNNQDFSGARPFVYQNDIVVSSLSNSYGPQGTLHHAPLRPLGLTCFGTDGMTTVSVFGSNFRGVDPSHVSL